jgi:hypothetical protein
VDESGQISRIYPSSGDAGATVAQAGAVPGGAVLDGKEGLERFYAVCTQEPISFSRIEGSIRSTVAPGVESVRRAESLRGLPRGSSQATLLVEKK